MIATAEVAEKLKPGMHASTFGGNPIACRAGLAPIETIEQDGLLERGRAIGERFRGHFEALRDERARPGPRDPRLGRDDRPRADDRRHGGRRRVPGAPAAGQRHARHT